MKPIEESFKTEKEILEEFFKNRKINKIIEDGLWGDEIYKKNFTMVVKLKILKN